MKHFTVAELDIARYKSISGPIEVVGGSRPRLTLVHRDNNQKFFFKTYTHNPREVWAECLASHIAQLVAIPCQSVTIKIAPEPLMRTMRERYGAVLPRDWKPVGTLARNIFPQHIDIIYGSAILDTPTEPLTLADIEQKIAGRYYAPEDLLQAFSDMMIFDALIGNMDRHHENWGVCEDKKYKQQLLFDRKTLVGLRYFTPLFDHGSSLMFELGNAEVGHMAVNPDALERYVGTSKFGYLLDMQHHKTNPFQLFGQHIGAKTAWRPRLRKSLAKISQLDLLMLAELIIQMPLPEQLEYDSNRRSVLYRSILLRYNKLKELGE